MATPSRVDGLLDDAQLARLDAHAGVELVQRIFYNALTGLEEAYRELLKVEAVLAPDDERESTPGPLFAALAELRELPAVRRAVAWDGTERRQAVGS